MKFIPLILASLLFCANAIAQNLNPNVSVDIHTGTGIINFPIYTVTSGSLKMPINLVYDASGLRVNDAGTPYGSYHYDTFGGGKDPIGTSNTVRIAAGWHLNVGGVIKRTVRALPDDYLGTGTDLRQGWLFGTGAQGIQSFVSSSDNNLSICDDEQSDYAVLNSIGSNIDTEPDVFNFSFGEFSGKFVFDHTTPQGMSIRPVHTVPYQDFSVSYTLTNNAISEFTIITNTGYVYRFMPTVTIQKDNQDGPSDYFNTSYYRYVTPVTYTEEWGLYAVEQPGGLAGISIQYSHVREETFAEPQKVVIKTSDQNEAYTELNATNSIVRKQYRLPIGVSGVADAVQFSPEGIQFLNSSDFRNPIAFNTSEVNGRTFLKSLAEVANCVTLAEHKFEYRGVDLSGPGASVLPSISSNAKDFWGYFNNTSDVQVSYPQIYIYPSLTGADRYRIHPIPGNPNYHLLTGANRDVNEDAVTAGILNQIITPSKGVISLDYESNEYYDQTAAAKFKGSGARVKRITFHDGISHTNDMIKDYIYDTNGGRLLYKPSFAYAVPMHSLDGTVRYPSQETGANLYKLFTLRSATDLNMAQMDNGGIVYETVIEREAGKGKTVYQYAMAATNGEISVNDYSATLSKTVRLKSAGICAESGIIENGYSIFPFPENTNYDFERGQLLNKKMYNETGNLVKEIQYTYTRLMKGALPYVIKGVKMESHKVNNMPLYQFGQYTMLTDVGKVTSTEKEIIFDQTNSTKKIESQVNYFYESANHRLLNHITKTNSTGIVYHTRIKYLGDFNIPSGGTPEVMTLYKMSQKNMYGVPIEQTSSIVHPGDVEKITGATLSIYTNGAHPDYPSLTYCYPYESLGLKIATPISNFASATIGSSNNLVFDGRYKVTANYLSWDKKLAMPTETSDDKQNIQAVITQDGRRKADITNARLSEVAFAGFKKAGQNFANEPTVRNMGPALAAMETLTKTNITKNKLDASYTFYCWIKSSSTGNLTVTLSDGSHSVSSVIGYTDTNDWKFYQCKIPVTTMNATFDAVIQSSSPISIDEHILLYPSSATLTYYTYNNLGKESDNDMNGNTLFYDYDMFRRLTHIRDQDNNILKRVTYPVTSNRVISADFHSTNYQLVYDTPKAGNPIYFLADDQCTPGTIYTWNFGDGSTQVGGNPEHTYQEPGIYTITLTTSHPQYGGSTKSITQTVIRNVNATVCNTMGPVTYVICNGNSTYSPCDTNPTGYPGYNVFKVDASQNTSSSAVFNYVWEYASAANGIPWTEIPNANSNTYQKAVEANEPSNSYQIRCRVTITDTHINPNFWEVPYPFWITTEPVSVNFIPCN